MQVVYWLLSQQVEGGPPLVLTGIARKRAWLARCRLAQHRGMVVGVQHSSGSVPELDRDAFTEVLRVQALRIPARDCQRYMKLMTGCVPVLVKWFCYSGSLEQ